MGIPVWTTEAGNLGTFEEGVYQEFQLEATDPDGGTLEYQIIAGYMPEGLVVNKLDGKITGHPQDDSVQDTTNTFCCRVTSNTTGQISDRTFSITITGQDSPVIQTQSQSLGTIFDGTYFSKFIDAQDPDNEPLSYSIASGSLPTGITLNSQTGEISGYAEPVNTTASESTVGWGASNQGWDEYPWNHSEFWINKNYQFTIEITDGKSSVQESYGLLVLARSLFTADTTALTGDNSLDSITADAITNNRRPPVVTTRPEDFGIYEHDNYFAYQFQGRDFDGDEFGFGIAGGSGKGFDDINGDGYDDIAFDPGSDPFLPQGLKLDPDTGWLYGYIGTQQLLQVEYNFNVYAYKKDNHEIVGDIVPFSMTIVNNLLDAINWKTPKDLGSIQTGTISELSVEAVNNAGYNIIYQISNNGSSRLPQGLKLLKNGLIVGRPTFEITSFDNSETTFDQTARQPNDSGAATFDQIYTFTVEARSLGGEVSATRTFTLEIDSAAFEPYESLYLKASPGPAGQDLFETITRNTDILPSEDIYRSGDPNFGLASDIRMLLISGLRASIASDYISAMSQNHYRKELKFGKPAIGKAYDADQNVIYEVIYYELEDSESTTRGSASRSINLIDKINRNIFIDTDNVTIDNAHLTLDGASDNIIYPNSLDNMRSRLEDEIGLNVREVLPQWMASRQASGNVAGWKPAVVLAYLKPGSGDKILFNLQRKTELDQKSISFEVDRYIWDSNLSRTYDASVGDYLESKETTFDFEKIFENSEPVTATVDFALDVPFNQIHGRSTEYIDNAGGLDNLILSYENKTVIFATQEDYLLYNDPKDPWTRALSFYDDAAGYDSDQFSNEDIIPGYLEKFIDSNVTNQRAGVWKIVRDTDNDIWLLEFQQEISQGDIIEVTSGFTYGGYLLRYSTEIDFDSGKTVPEYAVVDSTSVLQATTFDNGNTKFVTNIVSYELPDQNDKYLAFPKENIWH